MPCDIKRYGAGWREFSNWIRYTRARGRCECTGECGLHRPDPAQHRCDEQQHTKARHAKGLIRLTTAHLCQCDPPCQNPAHVKAMCQRCHLRVDVAQHLATRAAKRLLAAAYPLASPKS